MGRPLTERLSELQAIAEQLSRPQPSGELLAQLLTGARTLTGADGGTIYLLDSQSQLCCAVVQNESLRIESQQGESPETDPSEEAEHAPPVRPIPLHDASGRENRRHVAAVAALENRTINLPDVYADSDYEHDGIQQFDRANSYRTRSLLTLPIHNEQWGVIGVLQLINAIDSASGEAATFSREDELLAEALAFQAGTHLVHSRMQAESATLLERVSKLNRIAISLSSQESTEELLKEILISAKSLTHADAGTLYLLRNHKLWFEVMQTDSLNIHLSSADGSLNDLEPIPLFDAAGRENHNLVAASVALGGETINIPDAYAADGFNFSGTKAFDEQNGYRSQSFLTVAMHNQKQELIGVLQLINAIDPASRAIIPFSAADQELAESLASLAAVALTNQRLNEELKLLLESFIEVISDSIDEKSPYTGGHCRRVPELAMMLADATMQADSGALAAFSLSPEQRYEMRIAAMLHDCGKITTPVHVVDKGTKLETILDRIELLELRHEIVRRDMLIGEMEQLLGSNAGEARTRVARAWDLLEQELAFLHSCNTGGEFMAEAQQQRVRDIASKYAWSDSFGKQRPFLSDDEVANICIEKGTLTPDEREIINHHVASTIRMLGSLPFPEHLCHVPEIAGSHHERIDGHGYPNGLTGTQMSVQARILCIADVFEALTACDRPYKSSMPLSRALKILESMKLEGHIDPDLFDLFIDKGLYLDYGRRYLTAEQMDIEHYTPES